jgi:AraC-like DNA-binding protein
MAGTRAIRYIHKELQEVNPYIRICVLTKTYPGWRSLNRIIYDHEIVLILSGYGEVIIEDRKYECSRGDLLLIRPGSVHSMTARDEDPFNMYVVHFDFFYERERNFWPHKKIYVNQDEVNIPDEHLMRYVPVFENSFIFPEHMKVSNYSLLEILMKKLIDLQNAVQPVRELVSKAYLTEVLSILYDEATSKKAVQPFNAGFEKIKPAFDYINGNIEKNIRISELAAMCCLNGNYFGNLFKQQTGYSPNAYIIKTRIEKAKALLLENHHTISEVSEMVGFNDLHYFSFYFKKIEGMSPSAYRHTVNL